MLLSTESVRLDAWGVLGCREELERRPRERPGTYLELFHLGALGLARDDKSLVERALRGFEKLRLDWHAAQTRAALNV